MQITDNYKKLTTTNPLHRFLINNFLTVLLETAKPLHPKNVLDVGCGEGFTLERFREKSIGKTLEGIEYLDRAIELGQQQHPEIKINKGSIYELPYKDNSFDLVLCNEVLEHIEDPMKGLKELARVTKKYCLLSVPNEPIFMISNFLRGKNWSRWGNDIEHINHWSTNGFKKFISKELRVTQVITPFPWTLILAEKR